MKIQLKCPGCKKRLFDVEGEATGVITIKCIKCTQLVEITLPTQLKMIKLAQ